MPATKHLDQYAPSLSLSREQIPNIDLTALFDGTRELRSALVQEVNEACLDPGFFYVHNTCVKESTINAALAAIGQFFDSDDEAPQKQNVHNRNGGGMKGWGPLFSEPAYQKGTIAHVESFDIGQQLSLEKHHALGIDPNIWPQQAGFRAAVLDYYASVTLLGRAISRIFSRILGQEDEFINQHSRESAPRTLRMLHYPGREAAVDSRHVGIAAHTDFECFTIMHQTAPGLELTNTSGDWCQAPSDIGSFTVILGDMLERFSNGHLKATGHRVAITPWKRYSMILFFALDGSHTVEPLGRFLSETKPARYGAVTQAEHIENELRRAGQSK